MMSYQEKCKAASLPTGWRWREVGETPGPGDVLAVQSVITKEFRDLTIPDKWGFPIDETHDPVRTNKLVEYLDHLNELGCSHMVFQAGCVSCDRRKGEADRRVKDTNPKDAIGVTKTPYSTLSWQVMAEVGVAMFEGALKYGRHNYREAGVRASVYFDASFRHLTDWWEGVDIDPDSGMSHITKAIAGLMVLRDSMLQGNWVDDRPPRVAALNWQADLNVKVKDLLKKYPDPKPACTQLSKGKI